MLYYGLTVWGQQRKLRRAGPATARPRRVSRYGATLTPHSHGGPEVSGGRQGDLAAGPHTRGEYRIYTAAFIHQLCVVSLPKTSVSPVSCAASVAMEHNPGGEASHFSQIRQKP